MEAWARGWGRGAQSGFAGTGRQSGKAGAPGWGRLTRPSCALETATAVHEAVCVFCHDKKRCVMIPFASDRGRGRKGVVTTRSLALGSPFAPSHVSTRLGAAWEPQVTFAAGGEGGRLRSPLALVAAADPAFLLLVPGGREDALRHILQTRK